MLSAEKLLMVRPATFGSNPETIQNNSFQKKQGDNGAEIKNKAIEEFDTMLYKLREKNFDIEVLQEPVGEFLPDSVFPNNWFSTDGSKQLILYPMFSKLRRKERRNAFIESIQKTGDYEITLDLSQKEKNDIFLEGTGSIVFDHFNKNAFCCESPRSDRNLFFELMDYLYYNALFVNAFDKKGIPIYHTNVLMSIGKKTAVICMDCVEKSQRKGLLEQLKSKREDIIEITFDQLKQFAGNMLYAKNYENKWYWLMSETAFKSLNQSQIKSLQNDGEILSFSIPTIEQYGGGSVRCMLAELF